MIQGQASIAADGIVQYPVHAPGKLLREVSHRTDISVAFSQGRHVDRKISSEEEIGSEPLLAYHRFQISVLAAIKRCHPVRSVREFPAARIPLLQHASSLSAIQEELLLFRPENGASIATSKRPHGARCSCECAFFMSEQLTFQQARSEWPRSLS